MVRAPSFPFASCLVLLLALLGLGCNAEERRAEHRKGIERTLNAYMPLLAAGYRTGNLEPLKELATEKEVARVYTRVSELAAEGKYVAPVFHRLTIEDVQLWGGANAFVSTLEVWDLRVFTAGTDILLSAEIEQSSRVKYQLKGQGDSWQILHRELVGAIQ